MNLGETHTLTRNRDCSAIRKALIQSCSRLRNDFRHSTAENRQVDARLVPIRVKPLVKLQVSAL